jgi:nucleoside-diphosphate-sugar epimerase
VRALVTGSAGFIGRHFFAELTDRDWDVEGCDLDHDGVDALDEFKHEHRYDLVVHAASRAPHRVAIDTQPAGHIYNQLLDAAMFEWAVRTGQGRVLYFSSCAAADAEPDAYGLLKLTGERMAVQARAAGLPVTVVRPYSGYGEDQSEDFPFRAFIERARRREDPFDIWGDGTQVRDWIHVDDVVAGALAAVDADADGPVSLCTGVGTSMLDLAAMVCGRAGYQPEFRLRADAPAGVRYRVGGPSQLRRYYTPVVNLEQGVKRALE